MMLKLGQPIWCDCGIDILQYSVHEIRQNQQGDQYVLRSTKPIGRHREIEILVFINHEGTIRYLELIDTEMEDTEYGLGSFTEGRYFTDLASARNSFAKTQIELIQQDTIQLERRIMENRDRITRWEKMLTNGEPDEQTGNRNGI